MATTTPQRMTAYLRVSRRMGREGPGYISPAIQREAIRRWATYREIEVVNEYLDEDESGGTQQRPGLRAAMDEALSDRSDGIACWKIDRFGRNVEGALSDVKKLQEAGKHIAFVSEDIDTTGPLGELVFTILLAFGTFALANIRAGWRVAKHRAMERGAPPGPTPFGYERADDGTLVPHGAPEAYGDSFIIREVYELAASSAGVQGAAEYLNSVAPVHRDGARAGRPRRWTTSTVRRMLASRVYRGTLKYGDQVVHGACLPLVSEHDWLLAQSSPEGKRAASGDFILSGVATCAGCGTTLVGSRMGANQRAYRCGSISRRDVDCSAPAALLADPLEAFVKDHIATHRATPSQHPMELVREAGQAERALADAEQTLTSWATDLEREQQIGAEAYEQGLIARAQARDEARETWSQANLAVRDRVRPAHGSLTSLRSVVVTKGRGNLADRVSIEML